MSLLQIPGNIKQQFLPFVIKPKAELHQSVSNSAAIAPTAAPQLFTYRNATNDTPSGCAQLRFYPSSIDELSIKDDISFQLLYKRRNGYDPKTESITVKDILNSIPGIQIREFLPDTRLDECINTFTEIFKNVAKLFSKSKSSADTSQSGTGKSKQSGTQDDDASLFEKITAVAWYTMKYMIGATSPNLFDDLKFKQDFSAYKSDVTSNGPGYYIMTFPYTMYYNLQSCTTTNIYEIPGFSSDKTILKSAGGMKGWTDGGDAASAGAFRMSSILGKIPVIGNIANMILGNIGINYMPWWNAETGSKTVEPAIEIKFDLYNDSADAAMNNFLFVNTLIPNNKWIQYHMFQHSSNLYDVKIEGVNRLYACAGDFSVSYEGVLRDPPDTWMKDLVNQHANLNVDAQQLLNNMLDFKLIKIPDVYRVTLQFQSLLPANFNNYIFNYAENKNHIVDYSKNIYRPSPISNLFFSAVQKYSDRVVKVWQSGDSSAGENVK